MAKKTIMEKVADKVDHILHPEAAETKETQSTSPETPKEPEAQLDEKVKDAGLKPSLSKKLREKQNSDLQKHPKFAKFNK